MDGAIGRSDRSHVELVKYHKRNKEFSAIPPRVILSAGKDLLLETRNRKLETEVGNSKLVFVILSAAKHRDSGEQNARSLQKNGGTRTGPRP